MLSFFTGLSTKIYLYGAIAITAVLTLAYVLLYIRSSEANKAKLNAALENLNDYKLEAQARSDVQRMSDDAVRNELRDKWTR